MTRQHQLQDVDGFISWLHFSDEVEREVNLQFPQYAGSAVLIGIRLAKDCWAEGSESTTTARQHALRETMMYAPSEFKQLVEEALHRYDD